MRPDHSADLEAAREAAAVTKSALTLAGQELDSFTCELISKMGRGELTGDQAVEAIIGRFVPPQQRPVWVAPTWGDLPQPTEDRRPSGPAAEDLNNPQDT